ncbi:MAG TPA: hypothetical protein VL793_04930 [Patescibacteria group bacterium]|jgi:hypothetical protein|nr:hypothetical protein [Patescibacteria group bacterium]
MAQRRLLAALGLGLAVAVLFVVLVEHAPAPPRPPNPNGYDNFLKAAACLSGPIGDYHKLDQQALQSFLDSNAESLRLLRLGLAQGCRMPSDLALTNISAYISGLGAMKQLALLLAAESRLRELQNKPADAAQDYLDSMRFGNEMSRGGMMITRLVGIACESMGYTSLAKILPRLNREECRAVLAQMKTLDKTHVTWSEVSAGERQFTRYQMRHNFNPIMWVMGWWQSRRAVRAGEIRHKVAIANERLLLADLALRCYQVDTGTVPKSLADLVPNYLGTLPQDPFDTKPVRYLSQPSGWLVYSVGPDGVDDAGKIVSKGPQARGDIVLGGQ